MRYFSLFTGIGGFEIPMDKAGWQCMGHSETNKWASAILKYHWPKVKNYGDIKEIKPKELPEFDLLCGGFPCQAFSIAGKRRGFKDARGNLFFSIARIAHEKRPRYILLENVKGLISHDNGHTLKTIIGTLAELGYDTEWCLLNSKDYKVPQNRERIFIVGYLGEKRAKQIFPICKCSKGTNEPDAKRKKTDIARTIDTRTGSYPKWGQYVKVREVLTPDRKDKRQQGRRMKEAGEPMFTLTGQDKHGIYNGVKIRRLMPVECERLQGFPDDWTKYGINEQGEQIEISDAQRYRAIGNAVTTNVVEAIIKRL